MSQDKRRWTIRSIREWCSDYFKRHHIDSPVLDADLLLAHSLGMRRLDLFIQMDRPMIPEELAAFKALVLRRAQHHEPVAYIVGERGFWTLLFEVSPAVLIPRPETERIVEGAVELLKERQAEPLRVADIGTGSGALALSLASEFKHASVWATDISEEALEVARRNAVKNDLEGRVEFHQGDLIGPIPQDALPLDLIVSNPPYIGTDEAKSLAPDVLSHEPHAALFAGSRGLDIITRLAPDAFEALTPGGVFFCEIGFAQADAVTSIFQHSGFQDVITIKDYAQHDRVIRGSRPIA